MEKDAISNYLIALGLDPDETCLYWRERFEEYTKLMYEKGIKGEFVRSDLPVTMLSLDYIKKHIQPRTDDLYNNYLTCVGEKVYVVNDTRVGVCLGLFSDNFDYYWGILQDNGEVFYESCVGDIYKIL